MKESWPPQSHKLRMRSPRNRTWFCSTSIVAPRRDVRDAGLFELVDEMNKRRRRNKKSVAHKINDLMDVLPLPEAPMRRTYTGVSRGHNWGIGAFTFFFMAGGGREDGEGRRGVVGVWEREDRQGTRRMRHLVIIFTIHISTYVIHNYANLPSLHRLVCDAISIAAMPQSSP
jgi:hypothetical protein